VNSKYEDVPSTFGVSFIIAEIYFILSNYVLNMRFKELYKTIIENKKLLKQNRTLMEAFPDGVIVQTKESTFDKKILFSNKKFNSSILNIRNQIAELDQIPVTISKLDEDHQRDFKTTLQNFLKQEQQKINWDNSVVEEHVGVSIECPIHPLLDNSEESKSNVNMQENLEPEYSTRKFNIKTLEVEWDNIS